MLNIMIINVLPPRFFSLPVLNLLCTVSFSSYDFIYSKDVTIPTCAILSSRSRSCCWLSFHKDTFVLSFFLFGAMSRPEPNRNETFSLRLSRIPSSMHPASTDMSTQSTQFQLFSSLPSELRIEIWKCSLELEKRCRIVERCLCHAFLRPTKSFLSPLLTVGRESRAEVLRRHPNALKVYRNCYWRRPRDSHPFGWKLARWPQPVKAGVVHINWSDDTLLLFPIDRNNSSFHHGALSPALGLWIAQRPLAFLHSNCWYPFRFRHKSALKRQHEISAQQLDEIYSSIGTLFR